MEQYDIETAEDGMKSLRMKLAALVAALAFTLAGCGDALYVLTPEEEAVIVSYSSHAVAKFNKL